MGSPYYFGIKHRLYQLLVDLRSVYILRQGYTRSNLVARLMEIAEDNDFCVSCYYESICRHKGNLSKYCLRGSKSVLCR